ncbi:hypothetical protein M9434_001103 [Picochlorum sp. BPE23]|nr:hypothetical protein M9434_001103 [Picochlorum sp. BPE23]
MGYVRAIATVKLLLVCLIQWPHAVQSAPPVALYNDLLWNLGKEALFRMPWGLKLGQVFQNVGGANVTVDPPETTWYRYEIVSISSGRYLRLMKKYIPTSSSQIRLNARIIARNADGEASIEMTGFVPPPLITYRYPSVNTAMPLVTQRSFKENIWYTDLYPPDKFEYLPSFFTRSATLRATTGPNGQPNSRVESFGDESLAAPKYNWQGMKYTYNEHIPVGNGVVVTASLYIPEEWVLQTPNSNCSTDTSFCTRATEVAVEIGYGPTGSGESSFRLHAGFDNRDEEFRQYGPYVYLYADGPVTELNPTPNVWPFSPLGSYLAFGFPGPVPKQIPSWSDQVRLNSWNDFTFVLRRISGDTGLYNGVRRNCAETVRIEW